MSDHPIRWGVIGAGDVVRRKSGRPLQTVDGSRWTAVYRRNADAARQVARDFEVPRVHGSVDDLLDDPEVNAVYIATPPSSHADLAVRALERGLDVYLEKPMARSAAEARRIAEAAEASSGRLVMAHYRRALPAFEEAGTLLRDGAVGRPLFARIRIIQPSDSSIIASVDENWRLDPAISGGGLFHDIAPHQLDLMARWFGPMTAGRGTALVLDGPGPAPDYVAGTLRFRSGTAFDGLWSFCADSDRRSADRCEVYGSEGRIGFSFYGDRLELERGDQTEIRRFSNPDWIQEPMIQRVVEHFRGRAENPCGAADGLETMRMMDVLAAVGGTDDQNVVKSP